MPVLSDKFILRLQHILDAKLARMGYIPRHSRLPTVTLLNHLETC